MKKSFFVVLFAAMASVVFTSCNKEEKEISEEMSSGVVLIKNSAYYKLEVPDGTTLYFSGLDENGDFEDLAFSKDSIKKSTSYGTGFFVSKDGKIVTNNHVVASTVSDEQIHNNIKTMIDEAKSIAAAGYCALNDSVEKYQQWCVWDENNGFDMSEDYQTLLYYTQSREEYEDFYYKLRDIIVSDSKLTYHNEVSIAYNNSYVSGTSDFKTCEVRNTDEKHDLAVIQLKDKATPVGKYVFDIPESDPIKTYSWQEDIVKKVDDDKNNKIIMLGFNLGPVLAVTNEGIKSQHTSGTISQEQDDRIMYSIPALHGSSGSPVVNQRGELVAINYMGVNGTQSFNYGIRVKHLRNLFN